MNTFVPLDDPSVALSGNINFFLYMLWELKVIYGTALHSSCLLACIKEYKYTSFSLDRPCFHQWNIKILFIKTLSYVYLTWAG
jgi:hypothetical protein